MSIVPERPEQISSAEDGQGQGVGLTIMKKIYQTPQLGIIEMKMNSMLCEASAHGSVNTNSIKNEGTEDMVKTNNYKTNSVNWEDWQ